MMRMPTTLLVPLVLQHFFFSTLLLGSTGPRQGLAPGLALVEQFQRGCTIGPVSLRSAAAFCTCWDSSGWQHCAWLWPVTKPPVVGWIFYRFGRWRAPSTDWSLPILAQTPPRDIFLATFKRPATDRSRSRIQISTRLHAVLITKFPPKHQHSRPRPR